MRTSTDDDADKWNDCFEINTFLAISNVNELGGQNLSKRTNANHVCLSLVAIDQMTSVQQPYESWDPSEN